MWEVLKLSLLVSTVRTNTQEQTWGGVTGPARQGTRPALELRGCALKFGVCLPLGGLQSHAWLLLPILAAPDSLRLPSADAFASSTGLHGAAPLLPNTPFPVSGRTSKRRERQRWRSVHGQSSWVSKGKSHCRTPACQTCLWTHFHAGQLFKMGWELQNLRVQ